jgi:hypothetical protein
MKHSYYSINFAMVLVNRSWDAKMFLVVAEAAVVAAVRPDLVLMSFHLILIELLSHRYKLVVHFRYLSYRRPIHHCRPDSVAVTLRV